MYKKTEIVRKYPNLQKFQKIKQNYNDQDKSMY